MTPSELRLHAALDAAISLIEATASQVSAHLSEAWGSEAAVTTRVSERNLVNFSQAELRRNLATFNLVFCQGLRERVQRELAPPDTAQRKLGQTDWQSLSLVADHEVEERLYADRIGQTIGHQSDAELREVAAYMASVLDTGSPEQPRNPLRADVLGAVLYRAIEAVSEAAEIRKLLARDMGQAMARSMPACCVKIVQGMQTSGIQPALLTLRSVQGLGNLPHGGSSGHASLNSSRSQTGDLARASGETGANGNDTSSYGDDGDGYAGSSRDTVSGPGGARSHYGRTGRGGPASALSSTLGEAGSRSGRATAPRGAAPVSADAEFMALLRRLTFLASRPSRLEPGPGDSNFLPDAPNSSDADGRDEPASQGHDAVTERSAAHFASGRSPAFAAPTAINLIRAHRRELQQASRGRLDHMVIDVVGSLFDQILSDSRVPPQMARQIARLQLPVLRVALSDASFFSSRRHPVRRFINRVASLACAFDDFEAGPGKQLLARVRELVQEIVEGDFDQVETYGAQLARLEAFTAEQTGGEVRKSGAAATLADKESELRIQQRYMLQLQSALKPMALPAYLRDFLPQVWSQALLLAVRHDGPQSDRARRYRRVGRDLVMSVQPKGSPMLRKKFLLQLAPLMKDLDEGLNLIGWPAAAQSEFLARLLPEHAESLKGKPLSELDYNLMAKQLEAAFNAPIPGPGGVSPADSLPLSDEAEIARRFSAEEARRIGFVADAAVDWSGSVAVDIDLDAEAEVTVPGRPSDLAGASDAVRSSVAADSTESTPTSPGVDIDLDLGGAEPREPTRGPDLMAHVKLGFAYQMHLKDDWQKVRLAHVSAGRGFFVFTGGATHQETISMTSRMLARMCDTGRLRAVESDYLMERAAKRARAQLAALRSTARH